MFRKSVFQSQILAIALGATALVSVAAPPARAADIGARVYVQPWVPTAPDQDQVQTIYDDKSLVSDAAQKAWRTSQYAVKVAIFNALNGRRVAPGIYLGGGATQLNDATDFALSGAGQGAANLSFRVPKTAVTVVVSAEALNDAVNATGVGTDILTPFVEISFDILLSVSLNVSGNGVTAMDMHAIVQNPTVAPKNDAAKALKGLNDIVAFVGGPDFVKVLEDKFNNDDLKNDNVLKAINSGIAPIGNAEQQAASATGYHLMGFWGAYNRLTFYYAPAPITDIPTGATMTGNVRWDSTQFTGANCNTFRVYTEVQTGPRPLLLADGQSYGVAPTKLVGQFSARPALAHATLGGDAGSCDYTISGLPVNWLEHTSASTSAQPVASAGGSNPQLGNLHSVGYMLPVGWDCLSATPNPLAAHKDYEILRGMAGSAALGNPHQVEPGLKQEGTQVYGVNPAARILQQQGQIPGNPVVVNRLPTPQLPNAPQLPEGHGVANNNAANNAQSQAASVPAHQNQSGSEQHPPTPAPGSSQVGQGRIIPEAGNRPTVPPGGNVLINPQPLPPRVVQQQTVGSAVYRPGARIVNPQPNGTNGIK